MSYLQVWHTLSYFINRDRLTHYTCQLSFGFVVNGRPSFNIHMLFATNTASSEYISPVNIPTNSDLLAALIMLSIIVQALYGLSKKTFDVRVNSHIRFYYFILMGRSLLIQIGPLKTAFPNNIIFSNVQLPIQIRTAFATEAEKTLSKLSSILYVINQAHPYTISQACQASRILILQDRRASLIHAIVLWHKTPQAA